MIDELDAQQEQTISKPAFELSHRNPMSVENAPTIRSVRLDELTERSWDVLVVGGGMGGCAAAYALVHRGYNVLLIEKGTSNPLPDEKKRVALSEDPEFRASRGLWPTRLKVRIDGTEGLINPALGTGVGGSTLIYAAALGRFEPEDFEPRELPSGEVVGWPIGYADLEPYYQQLEQVFGVGGTPDPLSSVTGHRLVDPVAMGDCDRYLFRQMQVAGLNPYRLHTAVRYSVGCNECGGRICPSLCKGDARSRLALPAMRTGKLHILDNAEVSAIIADRTQAQGVRVVQGSQEREIFARSIILAAGALLTPTLLQRSASEEWPRGIGNDHDLVGRNLMFHASDYVAVWPRKRIPRTGPGRTIALRDFYRAGEDKLGEVQSMGVSAGYGEILTHLHQRLDQSHWRWIPLLGQAMRIPAFIGAKLFREATVFATIVEDFPYPENRVLACADSPSGLRIEYRVPEDLRRRVRKMRDLLKSRLPSLRVLVVNHDVSLNYGHACGTCRAGDDPETSVVDSEGRVHGMSNLYVADGSIMPTSGGANPSLTIGANALRLAERLADRLTAGDV